MVKIKKPSERIIEPFGWLNVSHEMLDFIDGWASLQLKFRRRYIYPSKTSLHIEYISYGTLLDHHLLLFDWIGLADSRLRDPIDSRFYHEHAYEECRSQHPVDGEQAFCLLAETTWQGNHDKRPKTEQVRGAGALSSFL